MNPNCVPVVLLVALCWMSVGTYAQTNATTMAPNMTATTMMPSSNATTMASSNATTAAMNSNATTMAANSSTAAPATTSGSNMTTAGTHMTAGSNMTTAGSNMTTAVPHMTTGSNMTTAGSNMTTAVPHMTAGSNMTTAGSNMTTAGPHMTTGSNMTTAGSNMTTAGPHMTTGSNMTTAGSNMTTAGPHMTAGSNMTTAGSNMTTAGPHMTIGSNMTTAGSNMTTTGPPMNTTAGTTVAATTTTAPPIMTNTTVTALQSNISRAECGIQRLCAAEPANCDPSTSTSCFLAGIKKISGRNMNMELAGPTDGYVAITLTPANGGNETAYVCAKINSKDATFICAYLSNGTFTNITCPVNNVKVKVTGNGVQCSFDVTVPDATARANDTSFSLSVVSGGFDPSTGTLGAPTPRIQTGTVDLANPNANTNNTITAAPPTTAGGITLQQSVSQVSLIILGVMSLAWL